MDSGELIVDTFGEARRSGGNAARVSVLSSVSTVRKNRGAIYPS
jgi:hypothetical protein